MIKIPAEIQKALDAQVTEAVEKAVASRATAPAAQPVITTKANDLNPMQKMGMKAKAAWLQSGYATKTTPALEQVIKAATAGTAATGGSFVQPEYGDFIEALRVKSVLLRAGARPMEYSVSLTLPKISTGTAGGWVSENSGASDSVPVITQVVLGNKKYSANMKLSNDLLRNPSVDAAGIIGEDLLSEVSSGLDAGFLVGTGEDGQPEGLVSQIHEDNTFDATEAVTVASIIADLSAAQALVHGAKLDLGANTPAWLMSAARFHYLRTLRDGAGYVFPSMQGEQPTLMGAPVYVTETLSDKIVFALMNQIVFGISRPMEVEFGRSGTDMTTDSTTAVAFAAGDVALRHTKAAALIDGVDAWVYVPEEEEEGGGE